MWRVELARIRGKDRSCWHADRRTHPPVFPNEAVTVTFWPQNGKCCITSAWALICKWGNNCKDKLQYDINSWQNNILCSYTVYKILGGRRAEEKTGSVPMKERQQDLWFPHTHSGARMHLACNLMCIYSSLSGLNGTLNEGKCRGVIIYCYIQSSPSLSTIGPTNASRFYSERTKRGKKIQIH